MDTMTKAQRSRLMARIGSVSMMEIAAGDLARAVAGCRLRHQPAGIHGRPDYANKARKVAVFVHGCYWHQPCPLNCSKPPVSNVPFWTRKFDRNRARHQEVAAVLQASGWRVLVLWEHEIGRKGAKKGQKRLENSLGSPYEGRRAPSGAAAGGLNGTVNVVSQPRRAIGGAP